jgi:hypothetical protein
LKIVIKNDLETIIDNQASNSATNVIQQGSKTLDNQQKPNTANRLNSKGNNLIDKERMINIDTLNPYMNKFVYRSFFF